MAEPLQNKALLRKLHITLFLFVILIAKSSQAQTLLLPGDVVFVSVSSTTDTFEFIPLINLEKGTQFSVSNGLWNSNEQKFSDDQTIIFLVDEQVTAGTPVKVGKEDIKGLGKQGELFLSEESEQLFLYQKDKEIYRFVSAVGWGDKKRRRDRSFLGSEIPEALKETPNSILRLGNSNNYQYYIRHGASGTKKMLMDFVSNPGYWRGNNENGFPPFGTSFNILTPPVILFDESFSSTIETSKSTSLQVAIYEHDGSKLTVDVVFDSALSSIDREEFDGFVSKRLNFTGLIGDAVYEVEIPVANDYKYEGIETGIFSLQNLSNGVFGDFITHSLIVTDDEIPELKLELTNQFGENVLMIHNLESKEVELRDWELSKGDLKIIFPRTTNLKVGESLVLIAESDHEAFSITGDYIQLDEADSKILKSSGVIQLKNQEGRKISELVTPKDEETSLSSVISEENTKSARSNSSNPGSITNTSNISDIAVPGWKSLKSTDINTSEYSAVEFHYWNEFESKFKLVDEDISVIPKHAVITGYFDKPSSAKIQNVFKSKEASIIDEDLTFSLSATDSDEDGRIQPNEGLNLQINTSTDAILVGKLRSVLNKKMGTENNIAIFRSSPDFDYITNISDDEFILPGQVFWVKIDTEIKQKIVDIDVEELKSFEPEIKEEIDKGILSFEVNGNSNSTQFTFSFLPEDVTPENELDLKLRKEIYLSEFNETVLTGMVSDNHYSTFQIDRNLNNIVQIPLHFTAPKSGEFEIVIEKWIDIPDEWVIIVEDQKEEKSYEINENWSIKFNYTNSSKSDNEEFIFPTIEDRFVLKVIPEALMDYSEENDTPKTVELHQNYPNPFNPATTISFYMPEEDVVKLSVFNIVGQPVVVLLQETKGQGEHTLEWDASDMPSGIYIYQLEVGTKILTRKMTLVK